LKTKEKTMFQEDVHELVQLDQQIINLETKKDLLKEKVLKGVKTQGTFDKDTNTWTAAVERVKLQVKACAGKLSFNSEKAKEDYPVLTTPAYQKVGKPYDHLTYKVQLGN